MKIVGLSGNPYINATNLKILEKIGEELKLLGHEFEVIHAIKDFPLFNPQAEYQERYDIVNHTRDNIKDADFVVITTPEYIGGVPAILKNALEWMLSESTLIQKPVAYIVHSPIGDYAFEALHRHLNIMGANLKNEWKLLISYDKRTQKKDGWFEDEDVNRQFKAFIKNIDEYKYNKEDG